MKNIAHTQFSASQKQDVLVALEALEAALEGKLAALTREERLKYGSVNETNKLLVNKVREYNQNQPALNAPTINWTENENDYQNRIFFGNIGQRVESIAYKVQSSKIMHDYDNYQDALTDYSYAQFGKGAGLPGFAEKVEELKQFFHRSNANNPDPDPIPTP